MVKAPPVLRPMYGPATTNASPTATAAYLGATSPTRSDDSVLALSDANTPRFIT